MVGNLLTVPLFAGPSPNPDEVFVYKGPSTEMHDKHLARLAPGTIQFRVLLQEQVSGEGVCFFSVSFKFIDLHVCLFGFMACLLLSIILC